MSMEQALQKQLKTMSDTEKHVVLSALIEIVCEYQLGVTVHSSALAAVFTSAQHEVAAALKGAGLK